jgi:hypothetical protein
MSLPNERGRRLANTTFNINITLKVANQEDAQLAESLIYRLMRLSVTPLSPLALRVMTEEEPHDEQPG